MDVSTITQLISTVGFPIVVCGVCFWYINHQEERHKEETSKLAEAIDNNTLVMRELMTKIDKEVK